MADGTDVKDGEPAQEEVSEALWNLYRAITSPREADWDVPLERARWLLIRLGYDPDNWDPPHKP